ncbi:MAG: flagellar basal body rod protein FlgB [Myxococcales bacterium]|nr:flagellar basal body rod protein FlgB [Myxococcales bacterium]MDD9968309.1 flagellar basal body rod protein FlgB [Myxococcales bacterium]
MSELFSTVGVLHRALDYHAERHNLLSSNVANADTPGFRPAELLRVPEEHVATNLPLARTKEGHQRPEHAVGDPRFSVLEDESAPVGADGNAVAVDREMAKVSANNLRYEGAARLVKAKLAMIRYVAGGAQG